MVLRIFWNISAGLVHRALNKSAIKPGMGVHYPALWRARPGFLDCDVNLHLNNASYLFNMELARWHFCAVNGVLHQVVKNKRMFLVASQCIRYRYPIPPFRPYEIKTEIVYWDDDWMYLLQQFQCPTSGKLYAEGLVRAVIKQGKTTIPCAQLFEEADGIKIGSPEEMPAVVHEMLAWDAASKISMETSADRAVRERLEGVKRPTKGLWASLTRTMNLPF